MTRRSANASSQPKVRKPVYDDATVDRIVREVDEDIALGRASVTFPRKGRPSLSGRRSVSPSVGFRLTPELRARAEAIASRNGTTVSALAREALEDYLRRAS